MNEKKNDRTNEIEGSKIYMQNERKHKKINEGMKKQNLRKTKYWCSKNKK